MYSSLGRQFLPFSTFLSCLQVFLWVGLRLHRLLQSNLECLLLSWFESYSESHVGDTKEGSSQQSYPAAPALNHNSQQFYPAVPAMNHNIQQSYPAVPAMNHNNERKKNFCQLQVIFLLDKKKFVFTKLRFGICLLFKFNKNIFNSYMKDRSKKECRENPTWWTLEFNSHQWIWRKAYRKINDNSTSSPAQVRLVKAGNLEPMEAHQ